MRNFAFMRFGDALHPPWPLLLSPVWLFLLIAAIACGGPSPTATPTPTPTPTPSLPPLLLPDDEAPHRFQTEWWYYNIHLSGPTGERYAVHYVVFQLREPLTGTMAYIGQVGVGEAQSGSYLTAERVAPARASTAVQVPGFNIRLATWAMEGLPGKYLLKAGDDAFAFDLELISAPPVLLHGDEGLVDFQSAGVSYYYSRPRLAASGTLTISGRTQTVAGLAWMDKQWGNFNPVTISWDWASIQLESGTNLMLTRVMDAAGKSLTVYGTLGRADGTSVHLTGDEFIFEPIPTTSWTSPQTTAVYPLAWKVTVPAEEIAITLTAPVPQSEYASKTIGVVYWEGGVSVSGTEKGQPAGGQGFVELTGKRPMGN